MFEILEEAGKQEILQQVFRKFQISDRLAIRYFPKTDVGCPCFNGLWGVTIILIRIIPFFLDCYFNTSKWKPGLNLNSLRIRRLSTYLHIYGFAHVRSHVIEVQIRELKELLFGILGFCDNSHEKKSAEANNLEKCHRLGQH